MSLGDLYLSLSVLHDGHETCAVAKCFKYLHPSTIDAACLYLSDSVQADGRQRSEIKAAY